MIASLMMYARPELEAAHKRYWTLIRTELDKRGIASPAALSNDTPEFEVWRAPDLVLSQTCGMPYRLFLKDDVALIGTPDFGVPGCPPGHYNSAIIVRADDTRSNLAAFQDARFIYNQDISQSGFAAIYAHVKPLGFWFANRSPSGGHRLSAQAVAEGRADIAAIDAVTWRLIERYDAFAQDLRVLEWTEPTPGLPYIAAEGVDTRAYFDAIKVAIAGLSDQDRDALGLRDLIAIPKEAYLNIPNPPSSGLAEHHPSV